MGNDRSNTDRMPWITARGSLVRLCRGWSVGGGEYTRLHASEKGRAKGIEMGRGIVRSIENVKGSVVVGPFVLHVRFR